MTEGAGLGCGAAPVAEESFGRGEVGAMTSGAEDAGVLFPHPIVCVL